MMYGVQRSGLMQKADLIADFPARIGAMLLNDEIDIGLVPVAIIPRLKEAHIITNYCIGAIGRVESVGIFSEVPLDQVKKLILDYQSRTSVALASILLKDYWKLEIQTEQANEDYRHLIKGTTAAVVIGDRALSQHKQSPCYYDLSEAWYHYTGLPFVFAAWVANKPVDPDFEDAFNRANAYGVNHIEEVVAGLNFTDYDLKKYYTQHISYTFDADKKKGMDLFLQKLTQR